MELLIIKFFLKTAACSFPRC